MLTFKITALVVIFFTGLAGGLVSRWLADSKRSALLFSLGNAFAGGVFLGAGLIHMLPDAREGFEALTGADYPWYALVCCCGFLFILFLERVLAQHRQEPGHEAPGNHSGHPIVYPYVLMTVLSIHSLITGIALGTESQIAQATVILIAVVAHKGTAAFALSVSLFRGAMPAAKIVRMVALFSVMTPLGIALGMVFMLLLSGKAEQAFEACFDALAAGTFLYVALLDILRDEFADREHSKLKFALVLAGIGVMAVVAIWT